MTQRIRSTRCANAAVPEPVQVVIYAFNHAAYIGEAIESVLEQRTNFNFKILVHDDASNDQTQAIIESYKERYPERFDLILQVSNQRQQGHRLIQLVWPYLNSKMIALLDGDDKWLDTNKLQTQYDFMVSNPDCTISHTKTLYFHEKSEKVVRSFPPFYRRKVKSDLSSLALGNYIHTSSILFRKDALREFPDGFGLLGYGDYAFFSLLASKGWIGYINEAMTLYRIHSNNVWFGKSTAQRTLQTKAAEKFILDQLSEEQRQSWVLARDKSFLGLLAKYTRKLRQVKENISNRIH